MPDKSEFLTFESKINKMSKRLITHEDLKNEALQADIAFYNLLRKFNKFIRNEKVNF